MTTRPSEYKPIYIEKVDEYLKACEDEWEEFHKTRGDKSDTYERYLKVNLPKIEGFAEYIGVSRKTIYNWQKDHEDFAEACDKILSKQKSILIDNGLAGIYSPVITKVLLSANHDTKEAIDTTQSTFSDEQVDRIAERIAARKGSDDSSSST
jgi:hypothetical protein